MNPTKAWSLAMSLILVAVLASGSCAGGSPSIDRIAASRTSLGRYELFEVTLALTAAYDNPYDPDEIDVEATFVAPSGKSVRVTGFFCREFKIAAPGEHERVEHVPGSSWKVRFAPAETGRWKYSVTVRDRSGAVTSKERSFSVRDSRREGFIRRADAPRDERRLVFDSGNDFIPIGTNIAWLERRRMIAEYERYFDRLSSHGANFARIWMASWNLAMEWSADDLQAQSSFGGIGRYSQENAWLLDRIFDAAQKKGISLTLTLGSYGDMLTRKGVWNEESWKHNPYNAVQGGPCASPADFWTNEKAKHFYRKRLRYIIARWGYSTNLMCIELWNELSAPYEWTSEMSGYVKLIDPYGHLVSTSLGNEAPPGYDEERIWGIPSIDLIQTHLYGFRATNVDLIAELISECRMNLEKHRKPFLTGEFGIDSGKGDEFYDRAGKGVHLHNGLWASVFSGACGSTVNWWWKTYVDAKNLYPHYRALSNFTRTVCWSKEPWRPVVTTPPVGVGAASGSPRTYSDVVIRPKDKWCKADSCSFAVGNDGTVAGGTPLKYLHGMTKQDLRTLPVFEVNFPADGKIILAIGTVSQGAEISVYIDDKKAFGCALPVSEKVPGKEGKSEYKGEHKIWWCHYNEDYAIGVPAGRHTIRLENTGRDWAGIEKITFTNYRDDTYLNVRVTGMQREGEAVLWLQNKASDWYNQYHGIIPPAIRDISFDLAGMKDGIYLIEWWDTYKGEIFKEERARASHGTIRITLPELSTDVACHVTLQ